MNKERKCYSCSNTFPLNDKFFYRHKRMSMGFSYECKSCASLRGKKYKDKNKETIKKNNKISSKKRNKNPNRRFSMYKESAKRRNLDFNITFEDFMDLWENSCFYCGSKIDGIGIDRKNNNVGYTVENIVPCCSECNMAKGFRDYNSFINWIKKVYEFLGDEMVSTGLNHDLSGK